MMIILLLNLLFQMYPAETTKVMQAAVMTPKGIMAMEVVDVSSSTNFVLFPP